MGIFGKILIVLNLLAAGGVTYLSLLDWNKRQEWAFAAFSHELRVKGLPVEAADPAPTDLDSESVAFEFRGESARMDSIKRKTLTFLVPRETNPFGSGEIANQTDEIKRVQKVLGDQIDQINDLPGKRFLLQKYLLNLAESGAERDGLTALLTDLHDPNQQASARAALYLVGRTPSQQTALAALITVSDLDRQMKLGKKDADVTSLRGFARSALGAAALADYPNSITIPAGGTREERAKQQEELAIKRRGPLEKLVQEATAQGANDAALNPFRTATVNTAADDKEREQMLRIAEIAGNLLDSDEKIQDAYRRLKSIVLDRSSTASEKKGLDAVMNIITGTSSELGLTALEAGRSLFDHRFEDANLPTEQTRSISPNLTGREVQQEGEKRRKIAHILYHLDADQPWENRGPWHQRVAAVVGINSYSDAVEAQATRLFAAAQRLEQLVLNEQTNFEGQYADLVRQAQYLADVLGIADRQLEGEKTLVGDHDSNLKAREGEKATLKNDLTIAKDGSQKSLGDFQKKQAELLKVTTGLREAQDAIFLLETKIRNLESKIKGKN